MLSDNRLDVVAASLLRTLIYYDVFQYPLTAEEVHRHMDRQSVSLAEARASLSQLVQEGRVYQHDTFYAMRSDVALVERRVRGNDLARKRMKMAHRMSRFISRFPYVRAVCLSGSISKDYMEPDGDIDFFIITEPGRLWIARTLLVLFKKVFLLNSYKYFCVNYFIDTDHLEIEEQNVYTATEVVTLIPTIGASAYAAFRKANGWTDAYCPNFPVPAMDAALDKSDGWGKKLLEAVMNNGLGEWLDDTAMRFTARHWNRKFKGLRQEDFDRAMKSRKYVSKHHPNDFQKRVLGALQENMRSFETAHQVALLAYD
ncbi:MAG: nucleotidyltransferase domain-containing protein [Bacteroidota bacterium]